MLNIAQFKRVDLNLLVLFSAVYRERNVTRAAAQLHLTPSAVSHGLQRLREQLGDPLFLRTPRGVVPSARAEVLAQPIETILAQSSSVLLKPESFMPLSSTRRFTLSILDGTSEFLLPRMLAGLARSAPSIDVSLLPTLPSASVPNSYETWGGTLDDLDQGRIDIAVLPFSPLPARFETRKLFDEEFVVAMRRGHPFSRKPTLESFCSARHLLVSRSGDRQGFIDALLAKRSLTRHVAVTVPSFMTALSVLADSNLIAALPARLARQHASRFDLVTTGLPLKRPSDSIHVVATKAAMRDAGIAFMFDAIVGATAKR